jgi:hypothetical protein
LICEDGIFLSVFLIFLMKFYFLYNRCCIGSSNCLLSYVGGVGDYIHVPLIFYFSFFFYFCIFSWYLSREFHDYFFCIIIILNIINEILEIFFDIFPSWNSWCSCFFSSFIYSLLFLRFKQVICNHIKRKKFVNGSIIFFYYFSFSAHADITRFKACQF